MPRTVHIVRGSNAAVSFLLSGITSDGSELFTVHETLSYGPLLPLTDVPSWRQQRLEYWRSIGETISREESEAPFGNLEVLASADEILLWLTPELADQIGLPWLPALLRAIDVDPGRIKTVQFHRSERDLEILGIGMLNPQQLAAHPPPASLTREQRGELDVAWGALTSPQPDELIAYLGAPSAHLPFLKRALGALRLRYPDHLSGLNAKELQMLRRVREQAPHTARILGMTIIDNYDAVRLGTEGPDVVGDRWIFSRMLRLGHPGLREPALEITGSGVTYGDTKVRLTTFGERILEGKANFVDVNGIDDWVAGVHLRSEGGQVWFHRDGELVRR
jgi:hypothetical protein